MEMVIIGRHINGITLNPLEYVLDNSGREMMFETEVSAKQYLKSNGYTDNDMDGLIFERIEKHYLKIGSYSKTDAGAVIKREYYREGAIFKDEEAYENNPDKICYIAELSDATYTRKSILAMCDNQEAIARDLFDRLDWQHPESLLIDDYVNGECDDCPVCGRMFLCYKRTECPHCHAHYSAVVK